MLRSVDVDERGRVRVPVEAMEVRAVRASGPGGQNVNKVSSKVELHVDLALVVGLDAGARARLDVIVGRRRDADGRLLVTCQLSRDQSRNLELALEKVRALVAEALVVLPPRRPTRPHRGAVRARLRDKKHTSDRKRDRRGGGDSE